jgi:ATP-dependent Lon protease
MELDALDRLAAEAFPGSVVRKDLALKFKGQYPVPTYVGEFLLGRYCASIDEGEIAEGLAIVQRQLQDRTVRAGEQELFKSRARERGTVKLIDLVTARLDTATDSYVATLPSLQLKDVRIGDDLVRENERMLTGGFYAEIELEYDAAITEEASGRPFGIAGLRPI